MESPTARSRLFLIGSDASHAMSASLWNPVLERMGSDWRYEGWDVPAGASMPAVRARLLDGDVVAANVTMPHKQWAAQAADTVSEPVRLSGAANLLVNRGNELAAFNTDVAAVATLLGDRPQRHAVMLGAGGAARAALVALRGRLARVTIADRDAQAAVDLASLAVGLGMEAEALPWVEAQDQAQNASLIVNATPIGKGDKDGPVWSGGTLAQDAVVYDFVYAGHITASVAAAEGQGVTCVDGWDHLQAQAAAMVPLLGLAPEACGLLSQTLAQIRADH
jgi:shikimate dehydrogenase